MTRLGALATSLVASLATSCSDGSGGPSLPLDECVPGVWVEASFPCDSCETWGTAECSEDDCTAPSLFIADDAGGHDRLMVYVSRGLGQFSAPLATAPPPPLQWEIVSESELRTFHSTAPGGNSMEVFRCSASALDVQETGLGELPRTTWHRAEPPLEAAVWRAWASGGWVDVPLRE